MAIIPCSTLSESSRLYLMHTRPLRICKPPQVCIPSWKHECALRWSRDIPMLDCHRLCNSFPSISLLHDYNQHAIIVLEGSWSPSSEVSLSNWISVIGYWFPSPRGRKHAGLNFFQFFHEPEIRLWSKAWKSLLNLFSGLLRPEKCPFNQRTFCFEARPPRSTINRHFL